MSQLQYQFNLDPASPGTDVAARRIVVTANGAPVFQQDVGPNEQFPVVTIPQGTNVHVDVYNVDDAGNLSPPITADFFAADTIAPPPPTGLTFNLIGETG